MTPQEFNSNRLERERASNQDYQNPGRDGLLLGKENRSEYQDSIKHEEDSFLLGTVAKIAGLGGAAYLIGRSIPKDIWVEAAHKLGQYGSKNFGKILAARNKAAGSLIDPSIASYNGRRARDLELSKVLTDEVVPFMNEIHQTATTQDALTYAMNKTRRALQDRFGAGQKAQEKLAGLTIGDVLDLAKKDKKQAFKVLGENSVNVIEEAYKKHPGLLDRSMIVDSHMYVSKANQIGKGASFSSIRDVRWTSRRAFSDLLHNGLGFQIPFVGIRPVELLSPFFRLADKRRVVARLSPGQHVTETLSTPLSGKTYAIGGELVNFGHYGKKELNRGIKYRTHELDSIAKASLARIGKHPAQLVKDKDTFVDRVQSFLGFGSKYKQQAFAPLHFVHGSRVKEGLRKGTVGFLPHKEIEQISLPRTHRLKLERQGLYNERELIENPIHSYNQLSRIEKLKARLGLSRYGKFVNPKDHIRRRFDHDMKLSLRDVDADMSHYGLSAYDSAGKPIKKVAIFEDKLSTKLGLVGDFLTNRLNQLLGATAGIGFRPGKGKYGAVWSATRLASAAAMLDPMSGYAIEAYKYVDYLFHRATSGLGHLGDGIGPSDVLERGFEYSTSALSFIKDITGVTSAAKYMEGLMPGVIESPLSGFARTAAALSIGGRYGVKGLVAGAGAAVALGGPSDVSGVNIAGAGLTTDFETLRRQYTGQEKVRVRGSRWWEFGRQSFYGEGTDRFEQHWLALSKSEYQYTNALYGSKQEYFQHGSKLPTFHNLFRLGRDSNYFAEKHRTQRPYPIDASGNELTPYSESLFNHVTPQSVALSAGAGYAPSVNPNIDYGTKHDFSYKVKDAFNRVTELGGIYKFLGETAFGKLSHSPVLADASDITDTSRLYWDKDLGSLLGFTELYRRFNIKPNDVAPSDVYNPISNAMPSFLPGSRSIFTNDRSYHIDFGKGDPFTRIKGGEYRLPGAGYEAANELHSGTPGVYSDVDAFLILADVAPYSEAYRHYEAKVSQMDLSDEWRAKIERARKEKEITTQGIAADFFVPKFSSNKENIAGINEQIKYSAAERLIGRAYENLVTDILPELGTIVPMGGVITHKLFPHHTAERDYLERVVYDHRLSDWGSPVESFIEPKMSVLYNENPLTSSLGAGAIGFMSATSPTASILRGATFGAAGAIASTYRAAKHGSIEGGYIPSERRKEESYLEYFDKLEYLRMERAKMSAQEMGGNANPYIARQRKTMMGLDYSNPEGLRQYGRAAVPSDEKPYFSSFINETDPEVRERIMESSPRYMRDIYQAAWNPGSIRRDANAGMAEFMRTNNTPSESWSGWNPGISNKQIMMKMMDTVDSNDAINLHKQKISMNMINEARMHIPDLSFDFSPNFERESSEWFDTASQRHSLIQQNPDIRNINTLSGGGSSLSPYSNYRIKKSKEEAYRAYLRGY